MKHFPNEISRLNTFLRCLDIIFSHPADSTGVQLGRALVSAGLHRFRDMDAETPEELVAAYLAHEQDKVPNNQGHKKKAERLRSLMRRLGLVDAENNPTQRGNDLRQAHLDGDLDECRRIVSQSLRDMELTETIGEEEHSAHSYLHMMRLVEANPGINVKKLPLSQVALDDSPEEQDYIQELAQLGGGPGVYPEVEMFARLDNDDRGIHTDLMGGGGAARLTAQRKYWENQSKLKSFAESVGDIVFFQSRGQILAYAAGAGIILEPASQAPLPRIRRISRVRPSVQCNADELERLPEHNDEVDDNPGWGEADYAAAVARRQERHRRHTELTRRFAQRLEQYGHTTYGHQGGYCNMDAFSVNEAGVEGTDVDAHSIITETKTLEGDIDSSDERSRSMDAYSQLQWYELYSVPATCEGEGIVAGEIIPVALFEREISANNIFFLESDGNIVVWEVQDEPGRFDGSAAARAHPILGQFLNPVEEAN